MKIPTNNVCHCKQCLLVFSYVEEREWSCLERALDFKVEGQRKKVRSKRTWRKQLVEESVKVAMRREDAFCQSKWSVGVDQLAAGLR